MKKNADVDVADVAQKRIFFSHGDKGGVGKSIISSLLLDALLGHGRMPGLVEGDIAAPDVGRRYKGLVQVQGINLNKSGAATAAVIEFGRSIEEMGQEATDLVVNLPAGAGGTLDELAEPIAAASAHLGFRPVVIYSIGPSPESTSGLISSIENGLMGAADRNDRWLALPRFLGHPRQFDLVRSGTRSALEGDVAGTLEIPALEPAELAAKVFSAPGRFSHLASGFVDGGLNFMERMIAAQKWIAPSLRAVEPLVVEVGDDDQ